MWSRSWVHFVSQAGPQDANKRWTGAAWQMQVRPTQCAATDEGIFGATPSKRGKLMGDDRLPPELGAEPIGVVPTGVDPTGGLEVFEIAGTIKWFDISKGYGFIVPDNGLPDVLLHV